MSEKDAQELARHAASKKPDNRIETMGSCVQSCLVMDLKKSAFGTWTHGVGLRWT